MVAPPPGESPEESGGSSQRPLRSRPLNQGDAGARPIAAASASAYGSTAERYAAAIGTTLSADVETPDDLDLLDRFVADAATGARALDAGCGTGRVARLLADRGLTTTGVDVAAGMVEIARREHPDVSFAIGDLAALPLATHSVDVAVAWYSIITTPPDRLGGTCRQFARVLREGGRVLFAFPSGDGSGDHRDDAFGSGTALTLYRHAVATVSSELEQAGFHLAGSVERPPQRAHEDAPQAIVEAHVTRLP
ncbi:MAG: class I SAM-dependent methyltransferase [Actinomycetota bacterium]